MIKYFSIEREFECPIDMGTYSKSNGVCFPCCGNYLSKDSFESSMLDAIRDYKTKEFLCFLCGSAEIPKHLIKICSSRDVYEKYEKKLLSIQIENEPSNQQTGEEIYFKCPQCDVDCIIIADILKQTYAEAQSCSDCTYTFCPKCLDKSHRDQTCDEYKLFLKSKNQLAEDEKALEEIKRTNDVRTCPHCGLIALKDDGCKFIYCNSRQCKEKKYFCWLCEAKIEESEHFTHFLNSPFGEYCINKPKPV